MYARIFSTLALWTITILAVIYFGAAGWTALLAVLAGGALRETFALLEKLGMKPMKGAAQAASVREVDPRADAACAFPRFGILHNAGGAIVLACFAAFFATLTVRSPYDDFAAKTVLPTIVALFAVALPLNLLAVVGVEAATEASRYTGVVLSVWILAAAKFSDVGAYVVGAAFGRRKMSPDISPNKTWEGAVGGLFSSAAVSAAIAWGFAPILPQNFTPILAATAGTLIGAVAIVSDLLESVLKRRADVKDSGKFIPGIGGALDLADSLLLSAPFGVLILAIIL